MMENLRLSIYRLIGQLGQGSYLRNTYHREVMEKLEVEIILGLMPNIESCTAQWIWGKTHAH